MVGVQPLGSICGQFTALLEPRPGIQTMLWYTLVGRSLPARFRPARASARNSAAAWWSGWFSTSSCV